MQEERNLAAGEVKSFPFGFLPFPVAELFSCRCRSILRYIKDNAFVCSCPERKWKGIME